VVFCRIVVNIHISENDRLFRCMTYGCCPAHWVYIRKSPSTIIEGVVPAVKIFVAPATVRSKISDPLYSDLKLFEIVNVPVEAILWVTLPLKTFGPPVFAS